MVGFYLISSDFMWSHVIFNHIKYEDFRVLISPYFLLFLIFANLSRSELVVERLWPTGVEKQRPVALSLKLKSTLSQQVTH